MWFPSGGSGGAASLQGSAQAGGRLKCTPPGARPKTQIWGGLRGWAELARLPAADAVPASMLSHLDHTTRGGLTLAMNLFLLLLLLLELLSISFSSIVIKSGKSLACSFRTWSLIR